MKKIIVECTGADAIPLEGFSDFQGKLKKTTKRNLDKLKNRIINLGFIAPIFIWKNKDESKILDGHSRIKALTLLQEDGYEIPLIPVDYITANTEKKAREILLSIASQYGEYDGDELESWLENIDASVIETIRLVDKEISFTKANKKNKEVNFNVDESVKKIKITVNEEDYDSMLADLTDVVLKYENAIIK